MGDPQRPPDRPIGDVAKDVVADDAAKTDGGRPGKTHVAIGGRTISKVGAIAAVAVGALLIGAVGYAVTRGSGQPASPAVAPVVPVRPVVTAPPLAEVEIAHNEDVMLFKAGQITVCSGGTLHLAWRVVNAPPGARLEIALTGPGIPSTLSLALGPDGAAMQDYPISGNGIWTTKVVFIDGKPAPSINSTNRASQADCR